MFQVAFSLDDMLFCQECYEIFENDLGIIEDAELMSPLTSTMILFICSCFIIKNTHRDGENIILWNFVVSWARFQCEGDNNEALPLMIVIFVALRKSFSFMRFSAIQLSQIKDTGTVIHK